MIHYHGTPVGGKKEDSVRFLTGRDALIPFLRQDDLAVAMDVCRSFMVDNSAFSAWKADITIDFNEYYRWVAEISQHPGFCCALIPDVIDGSEADNREMVYEWQRKKTKMLGVPVYHLHESFAWLKTLIEEFPLIALGSSGSWSVPGTKFWWDRISQIMDIICDDKGRPRTKLHGLRMLDPAIFCHLPFHSADSTNAVVNSGSVTRFGSYPAPSRWQRACVIADRIETHNSSHVWIRPEQKEFILTPMVPSADI